ncbi:MAG: carboxypeptidase-like regulatory domain-containing protein [Cyclobacteriaceae bacterium]
MKLAISALLLVCSFGAFTQGINLHQVKGQILDQSNQEAIPGASVLMINVKDSLKSGFGITDGEGYFKISKLEQAFYKLVIRSVGFEPASSIVRIKEDADFGVLILVPSVTQLADIEIQGEVVPVEQKGDTTQYNAAAFKTNPDATGADLVAKMPGLIVDNSGVTANGEAIKQVLLDGKRFFGTDPLLSLNNIPADIIDQIQIYDELSDRSRFTGFDDGNTTKTMNVVTKSNRKNGEFGRTYAGYGTHDRYDVGGVLNSFNDNRRVTLLGMSNNINKQNFSNDDLAGISTGGRRGGGRGTQNATTSANQDGITKTNMVGLNYSDQLGERTEIQSSYFYNNSNNEQYQVLSRTSVFRGNTQYYSESSNADTDNSNHRLNLRIDHKINKNAELLLRSSVSTQDNESAELTLADTKNEANEILNNTDNSYESNIQALQINNTLTYLQKLNSIGRTFSITASGSLQPRDRNSTFQDQNADSLLNYQTQENVKSFAAKLGFNEPVGSFGQLSLDYDLDYNNRVSDKKTYDISLSNDERYLVEGLSNDFSSGYTTHNTSLSYAYRNYDNFFRLRASYQYAGLVNDQVFPVESQLKLQFNNVLISAMGRLKVGTNGNLMLRYNTNTDAPSVNQLQEVIDNRNPLFLNTGNKNLGQAYSHSLISRFNKNNMDKNLTFSNFTMLSQTMNYIGDATTIIQSDTLLQGDVKVLEGAQLSMPKNLNGYWDVRNSSTFGKMVSPLKSNINGTISIGYTRIPGLINDEVNYANRISGSVRLNIASNISEHIDFNVFGSITANQVVNSVQSNSDSKYFTQLLGGKFNFIFGNDWVFRTDINYVNYKGLSTNSDAKYALWNMAVAKKVFAKKQGEFELKAFDLLGVNQSLTQQVTNIYVEEKNTQVLQTYFLMSFSYRISKFH